MQENCHSIAARPRSVCIWQTACQTRRSPIGWEISKHTAIAHGRWIYNKLDVHNRAELVSKLLSNSSRCERRGSPRFGTVKSVAAPRETPLEEGLRLLSPKDNVVRLALFDFAVAMITARSKSR